MTCVHVASTCTGEDVRLALTFMRHTPRPLCRGCRDSITAAGGDVTLVERRADDRPFQPVWLRNLRAKDLTAA